MDPTDEVSHLVEKVKKKLKKGQAKTKICKELGLSFYELNNLIKLGTKNRPGKRGRKPKDNTKKEK